MKQYKWHLLESIKLSEHALARATDSIKNDYAFMVEAVKHNGNVLKYASDRLKNNRQVVLEAVKNDGTVIRYASTQLQCDPVICLEAIKQNPYAIYYIPNHLKQEKNLIYEVAKRNTYTALEFATNDMKKNDALFYLFLIQADNSNIYRTPFKFQHDEQFVLKAVEGNSKLLKWVHNWGPKKIRNSQELYLAALKHDASVITSVPLTITNNESFIVKALQCNGKVFKYLSVSQKQNKEYIELAYKNIKNINLLIDMLDKNLVREERPFFIAIQLQEVPIKLLSYYYAKQYMDIIIE
jgi:hypothetical protein